MSKIILNWKALYWGPVAAVILRPLLADLPRGTLRWVKNVRYPEELEASLDGTAAKVRWNGLCGPLPGFLFEATGLKVLRDCADIILLIYNIL